MNEKAQLLVEFLAERYGLAITEEVAREDISNHVDDVAERMRIGRQAAKYYVTDDVSKTSRLTSRPRSAPTMWSTSMRAVGNELFRRGDATSPPRSRQTSPSRQADGCGSCRAQCDCGTTGLTLALMSQLFPTTRAHLVV